MGTELKETGNQQRAGLRCREGGPRPRAGARPAAGGRQDGNWRDCGDSKKGQSASSTASSCSPCPENGLKAAILGVASDSSWSAAVTPRRCWKVTGTRG